MHHPLRFALNRIVAPTLSLPEFLDLAVALEIDAIEIRNDLKGVEIEDGTAPERIRQLCAERGIKVLSINALYPFDLWNAERQRQLLELAAYAAACGAEGLVLCPLNDIDDPRTEAQRAAGLREALGQIAPILRRHGLWGLVEPLGFEQSALRSKCVALEAIKACGGLDVLRLVHDTFHHALAGQPELFPELTGLVHISGVETRQTAMAGLRDSHRVLVGEADLLGNTGQIAALLKGGYPGYLSFEPFADSVHGLADIRRALQASIDHLKAAIAGAEGPAGA